MFYCEMDWYKPVLKGFNKHILISEINELGIENILNQLQIKNKDKKDIFKLLSGYLKNLWNLGAYDLVIDFLVCVKSEDKYNYKELYKNFNKSPRWEKMIDAVDIEIVKAEKTGIYDMGIKATAKRIYTERVVGVDLDFDNIKKEDIDLIAKNSKKENHHRIFKSLFQYLLVKDELELIWYLFDSYIVDSLTRFKEDHIYNYLNLYLSELTSVLWNFAHIKEVYAKDKGRMIGALPTREFTYLLESWKDKDKSIFRKTRNKILFGESKLPDEMMVEEKTLNNLLYLYNVSLVSSKSVSDDMKDYFTYLLAALLLYFDRSDESAKFIYENNKYYSLDTLNSLAILVLIALDSNDFETVNMLYGMFLTEKRFLDSLVEKLENNIDESLKLLKELKDLFDKEKETNLFSKSIKNSRETLGDKLDETEMKRYLESNLKPIEAFRYNFFEEIATVSLMEEYKNYKKLTGHELIKLGEKLNSRLKAIFDSSTIESKRTKNKKVSFIPVSLDLSTTLDEEGYIETYMIPDSIKEKSEKIYKSYRAIGPRINNINYIFIYNLVNKALSEKSTYLYMENMGEIVETIIKDQPEKYKKLLKAEWNEKTAMEIFIYNYKNEREGELVESFHKRSFRQDKYKSLNDHNKSLYNETYNYFMQSYKDGDESYKEILNDPDLKKLLLTAEWFWEKELDSKMAGEAKSGQEFTYLVANYLKSVEIYLKKKIQSIYTNYHIRNEKIKDLERATLGNLYHEVYNNPDILEDELLEKIESYLKAIGFRGMHRHKQNPVFKYLHHFAQRIRNGYFHKDTIVDFYAAKEIRDYTLYVLRRIAIDFKR